MTHDGAPGWDSITAAFAAVYPDVTPVHKALPPGLAFGAPLQGVSAFPGPHGWHFVTYGLTELWTKESGFNHRAQNRSSGAYGIPQALPGSKMASKGSDWRTSPATQIKWGLGYIKGRYGKPCNAWGHSQDVGWY